ncbi:MAG TPA: FtsX-like permease family protein [Bacteroidales bacterium]|nr:FtsX-like permease family protein [Bacteroidales bacterium]
MKSYLLAWRNLWRNKRRTLITVASVFFAVFFALLMRSLQLGSYAHMFQNVIESYTGYIQVQNQDFRDNSTVDNSFDFTPDIRKLLLSDPNVTNLVPRFESFALASTGPLTKGVLVMGIDPEKEALLSDVRHRLVRYRLTPEAIDSIKQMDIPGNVKSKLDLFRGESYASPSILQLDLGIKDRDAGKIMPGIERVTRISNGYLTAGKKEALLGDDLARYLNLNIGDTLVMIGQGYHGTTAAAKFRIVGIVKLPTPDIDNKIVYLPIGVCQEFYNAPGMLTSMALTVKNKSDKAINRTLKSLGKQLPSPLRLLGWREMNELLINQMDADNKSGAIMIGILYLVIAFGIFGTVLMMTTERRREFGVLTAIGMQKSKLAAIVSFEMVYIGLLGILSGIAAALPVIIIGQYHPIRFSGEYAKVYESYGMEPVMPFMNVNNYFLWQSVIVAVIVLIAIAYPVRKIYKMKLVNSLKA